VTGGKKVHTKSQKNTKKQKPDKLTRKLGPKVGQNRCQRESAKKGFDRQEEQRNLKGALGKQSYTPCRQVLQDIIPDFI
jgi:hypothetical protein